VQHQVFGRFSGTVVLDNGKKITIRDFMGFAEKVIISLVKKRPSLARPGGNRKSSAAVTRRQWGGVRTSGACNIACTLSLWNSKLC
jgi:hypothetical protein